MGTHVHGDCLCPSDCASGTPDESSKTHAVGLSYDSSFVSIADFPFRFKPTTACIQKMVEFAELSYNTERLLRNVAECLERCRNDQTLWPTTFLSWVHK